VGRIGTSLLSASFPFEVVAPVLPTSSFLIDFDTHPDSLAQPAAIEEYWSYGVRFRTGDGVSYSPRPGIGRIGDNSVLEINSTTYPPGFNIIADLDMPVYGASVDVTSAAGVRVTMIARDRDGNELGKVESNPVPAVNELLGPLTFVSDVPIATLEWWPSQSNATVKIDDLFLSLTTPLPGDLNLDGSVTRADLGRLASKLGLDHGAKWNDGDFNHDGRVSLMDLAILNQHYAVGTTTAPVPEPSAAALLLCGAAAVFGSVRLKATGRRWRCPTSKPA
jgi:hypothetical protein